MSNVKKSWDILSKEKRTSLIREISTYFEQERDMEMGVLAAEDTLDFFLEALGKEIYNKAIYEAKNTIKERLEDLEVDLDVLMKK